MEWAIYASGTIVHFAALWNIGELAKAMNSFEVKYGGANVTLRLGFFVPFVLCTFFWFWFFMA